MWDNHPSPGGPRKPHSQNGSILLQATGFKSFYWLLPQQQSSVVLRVTQAEINGMLRSRRGSLFYFAGPLGCSVESLRSKVLVGANSTVLHGPTSVTSLRWILTYRWWDESKHLQKTSVAENTQKKEMLKALFVMGINCVFLLLCSQKLASISRNSKYR